MVKDLVSSFAWFREPAQQGYLAAALDRIVTTLNLVPRLVDPTSVRVLEIGGHPSFMTVCLREFFGYQVDVANEPTMDRGEEGNVTLLVDDNGRELRIPYKTMNIEYDKWPWPDEAFDIVLYCEVIEHLVYDPTHTLVEAHRVLKKGRGRLLLSTPNALCYNYLWQMVHGQNFYPPYSGYSYYARHHRLFSPDELQYLCTKVGFEVSQCFSTYDEAYAHPRRYDWLVRRLVKRGMLRNRLDVIYLLGSPRGEARYAYPTSSPHMIYGDVHAYPHLPRGTLKMSDEQTSGFRAGFYDLEPWGGSVRWTADLARLVMHYQGEPTVTMDMFMGPAERGSEVSGTVRVGDGGGLAIQTHFAAPSDTWQKVAAAVPPGLGDTIVIDITVNEPFVPAQHGHLGDERVLGVALRSVCLG